jgi:hypothetical protein
MVLSIGKNLVCRCAFAEDVFVKRVPLNQLDMLTTRTAGQQSSPRDARLCPLK